MHRFAHPEIDVPHRVQKSPRCQRVGTLLRRLKNGDGRHLLQILPDVPPIHVENHVTNVRILGPVAARRQQALLLGAGAVGGEITGKGRVLMRLHVVQRQLFHIQRLSDGRVGKWCGLAVAVGVPRPRLLPGRLPVCRGVGLHQVVDGRFLFLARIHLVVLIVEQLVHMRRKHHRLVDDRGLERSRRRIVLVHREVPLRALHMVYHRIGVRRVLPDA